MCFFLAWRLLARLYCQIWSFRQKLERPQSSQSLSEPIKRRKVPLC